MKTVFIVNPKAGQGKKFKMISSIIQDAAQHKGAIYYITKCENDAYRYVKNYIDENGEARFIACGGDGTLSEVLNAVLEKGQGEVGVVPIGTGNDFCRNFSPDLNFEDIKSQIDAEAKKCDAIKYTTLFNGQEKCGYCANMFNIGFDAKVADTTNKLKGKKLVSGTFAYILSIFITLIKKKTTPAKVFVDGKLSFDGEILLSSIANGSYCGGGIKSNPLASLTDGEININIVKNVSRLNLLTLLPLYMNGKFINSKRAGKYITSLKCKKVTIVPFDEKIRLGIDGEITDAGEVTFEIVPGAFSFVVPEKKAEVLEYV